MRVKFTNFPKEFKLLRKDLNKKFNKIGIEGQYVLGEELKKFEKNISKMLKVKHRCWKLDRGNCNGLKGISCK